MGWVSPTVSGTVSENLFFLSDTSSLSFYPSSPSLPLSSFFFPLWQTPVPNGCPLRLHPHNVQMKNEVIPLDRLVISKGTTAGELPAHVCVRVCVWVHVCMKRKNCCPGGLGFEYVIFQCIIGGLGSVTSVVLSSLCC